MEGATPAARRKTERGRFGANSFGTEQPRSFLGGFAARVAPVIRGESVGKREARTNADEHTLDRDPRPMAQARATFGRSKARTNRARGWESQGQSLEERERTNQRRARERGRVIVGKTRRALQRQRRRAVPKSNGNSATELGLLSHSLLGAGVVVVEPL